MNSAKRHHVLRFVHTDNFSQSRIKSRLLPGKILSVLWQEITQRTTVLCNYKFDSSNKKQIRDFSQRQRELTQDGNRALEDQREILVTIGTSQVWKRYERSLSTQYATCEQFANSICSILLIYSYDFFADWNHSTNSHTLLIMEDPKREKPNK